MKKIFARRPANEQIGSMKLPALSFWQPYAWLIVNGHAAVDSREWSPPDKYIGKTIAIHASKRKVTKLEFESFLQMVKDLKITKHPQTPDDFDYGAIVGTVQIDGVSKNSKSYFAHPGFFHWALSSPKTISPLPKKGMMGWFHVEL